MNKIKSLILLILTIAVLQNNMAMAFQAQNYTHSIVKENTGINWKTNNLIAKATPITNTAKATNAEEPKQQSFLDLIFKMLNALFNVILLIAALFGLIKLNKWLKNKNNEEIEEQEDKTPQSISEAVSSFVRNNID